MTLYLIPNTLGNKNSFSLSLEISEIIPKLQGLIAESEGGGRAFLRLFKVPCADVFPLAILNKQNSLSYFNFLLEPLLKGEHWGLVSDAGLPCIADPGSLLVKFAREQGITVKAFSGPCSITMALMLSGFCGQQFVFFGYPPQKEKDKKKFFKKSEEESKKFRRAIVFIETPYRNKYTFLSLINILSLETSLSISCNLTLVDEYVNTLTIRQWRELDIEIISNMLVKKPAVFIIYSEDLKKLEKIKKT